MSCNPLTGLLCFQQVELPYQGAYLWPLQSPNGASLFSTLPDPSSVCELLGDPHWETTFSAEQILH